MKFRINLKIIFFLIAFAITRQLKIYFIIMSFAFLHELAHIFVGRILKYKTSEIEIMPFGFWARIEPNYKDYNKDVMKSKLVDVKNIFIALAGPLLNLIFSIIFIKLNLYITAYSNLIVFTLNMIPIYPLDGGRVLQSVCRLLIGKFKSDKIINIIANIIVIILTGCGSIAILYLKNIAIALILVYLWELVIRENKRFELKKKAYEIE